MSWFNSEKRQALAEAREIRYALYKNLTYSRDTLASKDVETLEQLIEYWDRAVTEHDMDSVQKLKKESLKVHGHLFPAGPWDSLRENIEVFVVAIVIALAVRSYFLQPFKIPTGSMQPTLNGVQVTRMDAPMPSLPQRLFEMVAYGRTYGTIESPQGGLITAMRGGSITPWFEYTDVYIGDRPVRVWANPHAVSQGLKFGVGSDVPAGGMMRYRIDTGDQVLVNKVIYNFRKPKRGEVFVFKTTGISFIEDQLRRMGQDGSQFYIKRCVGVPGDLLCVDPPYLKVNGSVIHDPPAFDRVYSRKNGYNGYSPKVGPDQKFLTSPTDTYQVQPDYYWAMGDNSFNSSDSRFFGPVPADNLIGTGFIVYWPFTSHWGLIH